MMASLAASESLPVESMRNSLRNFLRNSPLSFQTREVHSRTSSGTSPRDMMFSYICAANPKAATHSLGEMTGSWGGPKSDLTFSGAVAISGVIVVPSDTEHYNRPRALSQTIGRDHLGALTRQSYTSY